MCSSRNEYNFVHTLSITPKFPSADQLDARHMESARVSPVFPAESTQRLYFLLGKLSVPEKRPSHAYEKSEVEQQGLSISEVNYFENLIDFQRSSTLSSFMTSPHIYGSSQVFFDVIGPWRGW